DEVFSNTQIREQCCRELQAARKKGLLAAGSLEPKELAQKTGLFARFEDPEVLLDAEWKVLKGIGQTLEQAGHRRLAWFVALRPASAQSLPVPGVRYFFRREIESDPELFQGLAFTKLTALQASQAQGFAALETLLKTNAQRLEQLLADVRLIVQQTHQDV